MPEDLDRSDAPRQGLERKSMAVLGWRELLKALSERAAGEPARRECLDPTLFGNAAACEIALTETGEMVECFARGDPPPPAPISDVAMLVETARAGGTIDPADLVKVMDLLVHAAAVAGFFRERDQAERLAQWAARLSEAGELRRRLERCIDRDGTVLDSAGPELRSLRKRRRTLNERIHRRLGEIVANNPDTVLQDSFYTQRGHRYVVPVKASERNRFGGIVHDASASGQTVFVEPAELVESNNRLRLLDAEIEEEIVKILRELSARVADSADRIVTNQRVLTHLEVVRARARLAGDLEAQRPRVNDASEIDLKNARHPLLALRGHRVKGNDLRMGGDARVLVVSGPNAGGKTVALTMIGLLALMTRAGMFIPTDPDSEMAVCTGVYAVIGDEQDLSRDLSSFTAHLLDLKAILEFGGPGSLVLLDELMSSTDPEEGSALGMAILSMLRDRGALVAATTHFPALKSFAHEQEGFLNVSFTFEPETFSPTYRLEPGVPGRSMGIEMAARMGIAPELIGHARSHLSESSLSMESLIGELSARLQRLDDEGERLERLKAEAEARARRYRDLVELAERREREVRLEAKTAVREALRRAEDEIEKIMRAVRAGPDAAREDLIGARQGLRDLRERADVEYGEEFRGAGEIEWSRVGKGDRVLVMPLGIEGEIVEVPEAGIEEGTEVQVKMGQMKFKVEARKLKSLPRSRESAGAEFLREGRRRARQRPDRPPAVGGERPGPERESSSPPLPQSSRNTLDLRGLRYYEAEARVESFLDRIAGEELPNVFIIHGHGTGALKKMVREHLSLSPYVKDFRPGEQGEGGDGVTVAELK